MYLLFESKLRDFEICGRRLRNGYFDSSFLAGRGEESRIPYDTSNTRLFFREYYGEVQGNIKQEIFWYHFEQ